MNKMSAIEALDNSLFYTFYINYFLKHHVIIHIDKNVV